MELLEQLEKIRNPFLTYLFRIFTEMGAEIAVIAVICAVYWCYNKKLAYRLTFGLFISALIVQALKITYRIPRPWVRYPNLKPISAVIKSATGYSFPSGHTQSTTALYGALAISAKTWYAKAACVLMIFGVGFSRMYLGMHTLQDVLTSLIITLIVVIIIYYLSKLTLNQNSRLIIATIVGAMSIALLAYSTILNSRNIIADEFASDSCQAAFAGIGIALGWYIENRFIRFDVKTRDPRMQIVKYVVGIGITVGIKLFTKALLPDTILVDGVTNFVLVMWILVGYPMIFQRALQKRRVN